MYKTIKYSVFVTIIMMSLLITACGGETTAQATQAMNIIETAVAETVAAQNTIQSQYTSTPVPAAAPVGTQTPLMFSPTLTPLAPIVSPTRQVNTTQSQCASASMVSETVSDGMIFSPGQVFTKTWEIMNTSTCTWDTSYKIVFWNGDVLGGAYYYNLPQVVVPGQTVPISLVLTAPKEEATYKSEWKLQTPDSVEFGVGQYSSPFFTEIEVSADTTPNYTITAVDFSMERVPATGCVANETHTLYVTITTNGPVDIQYHWVQSDGNNSSNQTLRIKTATTKTLSRSWQLHLATNTGTRWIQFVVTEPFSKEYPKIEFTKTCGG